MLKINNNIIAIIITTENTNIRLVQINAEHINEVALFQQRIHLKRNVDTAITFGPSGKKNKTNRKRKQ